jgi:hypothetical protein
MRKCLRPSEPNHRQQAPPGDISAERQSELGQATAEYALVMLAAAALAGLLIAWAASTDGVGRLLDAVLDSIIQQAG